MGSVAAAMGVCRGRKAVGLKEMEAGRAADARRLAGMDRDQIRCRNVDRRDELIVLRTPLHLIKSKRLHVFEVSMLGATITRGIKITPHFSPHPSQCLLSLPHPPHLPPFETFAWRPLATTHYLLGTIL